MKKEEAKPVEAEQIVEAELIVEQTEGKNGKDNKNNKKVLVTELAGVAAVGAAIATAELWQGDDEGELLAVAEPLPEETTGNNASSLVNAVNPQQANEKVEPADAQLNQAEEKTIVAHSVETPQEEAVEPALAVESMIASEENAVIVDSTMETESDVELKVEFSEEMAEAQGAEEQSDVDLHVEFSDELTEVVAAVETDVELTVTDDLLAYNEPEPVEMPVQDESFAIEDDGADLNISAVVETEPQFAKMDVEVVPEEIQDDIISVAEPASAVLAAAEVTEDDMVDVDDLLALNEIDPNDIESKGVLNFEAVGSMIGEDGAEMATATYSYEDGQRLMLVDTDGDQIFDHIASEEGKLYFAVDYHLSVGDVATMVDGNDSYLAQTDVDTSDFDFANDLITT